MLNHKGTQPIRTQRLLLRQFTEDDGAEMYENWTGDEQVALYVSWHKHKNVEESKTIAKSWAYSYRFPHSYNWGIELDGRLIGNIAVVRLVERDLMCEVGFCLSRDYWNQGIMTEALKAVIEYLFSVGFHRVSCLHKVENSASGRVLQKAGMGFEGILKGYARRKDGGFSDSAVYGIINNN